MKTQSIYVYVFKKHFNLIDIDSSERVALFSELFKCINELTNEEIRKLVTEQYSCCFNFESPQIICDLIQSMCITIKFIPSFLILSETYISYYFNNEGLLYLNIELLYKCFSR